MYERNTKQGYTAYFKAAYAAVFTISTFMLAKSTGYLFGNSDISEENKVSEDINTEKNLLDLRRSIEQDPNQTINQETSQSLQLVNSTFIGSFGISDIQGMVIQNNIAYIAAGNDGFQVVDITNINNPIFTDSYQLTGGFAHQLNLVGNYAYIAYDLLGLRIVDITNPYNISLAGVYMAGEIPTKEPVVKVAIGGNIALVITNLEKGQFEWVDISQPTKIFRVYLNTPGVAYDVSVVGDVAYVAGSGLQLINVSDPSNPSLLGSFNLVGVTNSVSVLGGIAYVAGISGLQLINVSNPTNPSLLGSFSTSGDVYGLSVVGGIAYVAYYSSLQLIDVLQLINVSNPANPSLLGSFNVSVFTNSVSVVNSIAYVANDDGILLINVSNPRNPSLLGSFNSMQAYAYCGASVVGGIAYLVGGVDVLACGYVLQLINVSNPRNPSLLGSFSLSMPGDAKSVSVVGGIAYVAGVSGLQVINVSNPRNPSLLGSFSTLGGAYDVSVVGSIAYVAGGASLQIFDVSRGFSSYLRADILENKNKFINDVCTLGDTFFYTEQDIGLVLVGDPNFIVGGFTENTYYGISVVGGIAYVADNSGLQLINVSNPANPNLLGSFTGGCGGGSVVGGIAYLTGDSCLQLINVSNPTNLTLLGNFNPAGYANDVTVVGGIAYVAEYPSGLQLVNVSNSTSPSLLGSFSTPGDAYGVSVVGSVAYVADYSSLQVINVSNPRNPSLLSSFNTGITDVSVVGGIAYVTGGAVQLIDVSDPTNPSLLSSFNTNATDISVVGGIVYLAADSGLQLIDVSDPSHPQLVQNYNVTAQSLAVSAGFAYVVTLNSLQIINLATEKSSFETTPWIASQITAQNNIVYLSDADKDLYILDITNTSNPIEISRYILNSQATDMIVSELSDGANNYIYLYVAESLNGVEVVDVTNANFPVYAGSITEGIVNARTLQVDGNTLYVNNNNVEILAFDMTVLHYLNVSANHLIFSQDRTTLTDTQLNVIAVNPFDVATRDIDSITYNINTIQQGQFVFNNVKILSFTQAQINNQSIQFVYNGNGGAPSFSFNLSNGNVIAGPFTANIDFILIPQPPVIKINNITCNEGQTVLVTPNNISALNADGTPNSNLIFIVNNMGNSQFEYVSNPGVIILQFSQSDVNNLKVHFVQIDGANNSNINDILPFYQLAATNGLNQSAFNNATIDFDATPKIIQNQIAINKGESIILNPANLNATDIDNNLIGNLSFQVSNVTNGQFAFIDNPNIDIYNFTQQQINNGDIIFIQDGSDNSPNYLVSVTDGRATSPLASPTVSFNNQQTSLNAGVIAGGVIGGIAGLAVLIAGGGFFAKSYRDAATRELHPFANAVQTHLKLNGMDNFKTEQGRKFVRLMEEDMSQAFLSYGFDIKNMRPNALDDLAKNIATEAKNKITGRTTTFGYSEIQLDQLESKINNIAQAVSQYKDRGETRNSTLENNDDNYDNYYLLEDDDVNIPLKPFMPSFSLRAGKFENV